MRVLLVLIVFLGAISPLSGDDAAPAPRIRAEDAMRRKVEKPAFSGPLEKVLAELAERAEVDIQPDWRAIEATGAKRDAQVVLRASSATFGQLLDIALIQASAEQSPLAWYADGPTVRVTTQMRAIYGRRRPQSLKVRTDESPAPADRPRRGIGVRFDEIPLADVIEFFRNVSGANFHVNWGALESVGIDRDTPVSLRLSDVTIGRALNMVCDRLSGTRDKMQRVYWVIDDGVVHIATGEALNRRTQTRVFEVADLLMVAPDYPAPAVDSSGSETTDGTSANAGTRLFDFTDSGSTRDEELELRTRRREELTAAIRESIGEEMWRPIGKGSIRIVGNQLVITQTPLGFKLLSEAVDPL